MANQNQYDNRKRVGIGRHFNLPLMSLTASSNASTYTETGSYAGVPQLTSEVSAMQVNAFGHLDGIYEPITVATLHGGLIGEGDYIWSGSVNDAGTPLEYQTGQGVSLTGTIDQNRGWEWPGYVRNWGFREFDADTPSRRSPAVCSLSPKDGRIYSFYEQDDGTTGYIMFSIRDIDGNVTTAVPIFRAPTAGVFLPAPVVLPDDRVILYFLRHRADDNVVQLQSIVINPDGSRYDYETRGIKDDAFLISTYGRPFTFTNAQMRGAAKPNGEVVLVLSYYSSAVNDYNFIQLGSYDGGHSFSIVDSSLSNDNITRPDIVYYDGAWVMTYVDIVTSDDDVIYSKRIGHWSDSLVDVPAVGSYNPTAIVTETATYGNALCVSPDGILYSLVSTTAPVNGTNDAKNWATILFSDDLGSTWNRIGKEVDGITTTQASWYYAEGALIDPDDAGQQTADQWTPAVLRNLTACYQGNRVYVQAKFDEDNRSAVQEGFTSIDGASIIEFYLGGWSNQQKPFRSAYAKEPVAQLVYQDTFFGFTYPQFNGWTINTNFATGTGSYGITSAGLFINTSTGGMINFRKDYGAKTLFVSFEYDVLTILAGSDNQVGVRVVAEDPVNNLHYLYAINHRPDGIQIKDLTVSSVGDDGKGVIPVPSSQYYTYRVEQSASMLNIWARPTDSSEDQMWQRLTPTGSLLLSEAGTTGSTSVTFGIRSENQSTSVALNTTASVISSWKRFELDFGLSLCDDSAQPSNTGLGAWFDTAYLDTGSIDAAGQNTFNNGYPFTTKPVTLKKNLSVAAAGGPAYAGDSWQIEPAYQYSVGNLNPITAPKPSQGWRSINDDSDVILNWLYDPTTLPGLNEGRAFFVYMQGTNFESASFGGLKQNGNYENFLSCSFTRFANLDVTNRGGSFACLQSVTTRPQYVEPDELAGSYVIMDELNGMAQILGNTGGQIGSGSHRSVIRYDNENLELVQQLVKQVDMTGSNTHIVMDRGLFVTTDLEDPAYRGFRLTIPAQQTAEGYFKCDKIIIGWLNIFGIDPTWGYTTDYSDENTLVQTTQAGHTETRVYNDVPRIITLGWTENNLDSTHLESPDPYVVDPGKGAVGFRYDVVQQMEGTFRSMKAANECFLFSDAIPLAVTGSFQTSVLDPKRLWYVRFDGPFSKSNVMGDPTTGDEIQQITSIVLKEQL